MQLHRLWQETEEPTSSSGISDPLLTVNGIASAEQTHAAPQRSFRVTGNRICMNMKKHGYTSMEAAGIYPVTVNLIVITGPQIA
jgi:hypothetical protein